jgi:CMP-N,N'-diacetyllegionaminic acid synthase
MEILAIIPARSGSKGIPLKNIQKIVNKPLIEYTITSAKKSSKITRIIVSTDDEKIAKISKSLGAEVPFIRPKKISNSNTPTMAVVKHTLKFLHETESYLPDIIVILQPTSPLRKTETIDKSILLLQKTNSTSVLGVSKVKIHPFLSFYHDTKYLKPLKSNFQNFYQRQKFPIVWYPTGSIYTFWHKTLLRYNSYYGPKIKPIFIDEEDSVDVDTIFDLFICDMKIKHWKKFKKRFDNYSNNSKLR